MANSLWLLAGASALFLLHVSAFMDSSTQNLHRFRNNASAVRYGNQAWEDALAGGLIDIKVRTSEEDRLMDRKGHRFVNLCSCSYLGLDKHPAVIEGAIQALQRERVIDLPISRVRICLSILEEFEAELSSLFRARVVSAVTASAASAGVLPLLASGHLTEDGQPRVMVFDKHCHFSMNLLKPVCADETLVLTSPHNDLNYLEDVCKKYPRVAYVADGVYSMGGSAPIRELLELQDRYGLFLFLDDSHSLSLWGEHGEGYARSMMGELGPLTIIVASLCKGFGGSGGIIMMGPERYEPILARFGGPLAWSQGMSVAAIGAGLASARIHRSPELGRLQQKLRDNVTVFDEHLPTRHHGNGFPLKLVDIGEESQAVRRSAQLLERGFYTSAVFFPIVERNRAGLRVMIRADNRPEDLVAFAAAVRDVMAEG
jgi:7-keto-8-aminopelargonate synthetase-like enzyme